MVCKWNNNNKNHFCYQSHCPFILNPVVCSSIITCILWQSAHSCVYVAIWQTWTLLWYLFIFQIICNKSVFIELRPSDKVYKFSGDNRYEGNKILSWRIIITFVWFISNGNRYEILNYPVWGATHFYRTATHIWWNERTYEFNALNYLGIFCNILCRTWLRCNVKITINIFYPSNFANCKFFCIVSHMTILPLLESLLSFFNWYRVTSCTFILFLTN